MAQILGYEMEAFIGTPFQDVITPHDLETWIERFRQRTGDGEDPLNSYDIQFVRQDKQLVWIELRANRLRYLGKPSVLGIARDITERKRHEESLRLAEEVFNSTQEAIVVTDMVGGIIAANPAFSRVTEYPIEELIGRNMNILHSGRQNRDFYQQMWASIRTNGTWQGAIWNRRKGGDIYPEWLTISAVTDANGHGRC